MGKFFEHIKKDWYRYLLETFVVIVSILVALSLENRNDQRKDRLEEIVILKSLHSEFGESIERLDSIMIMQKRTLSQSRELLTAFENNNEVDPDSLSQMIYAGALGWHRYEPITGAYDAIIGSGKLDLIQNIILRKTISEYYADIKPEFEDQTISMDLISMLIKELGKDLLPLRGKDLFGQELIGIEHFKGDLDIYVESVMSNEEFFGLLYSKTVFESYRLYYYMFWRERVSDLKSQVGNEIEYLE